MSTPDSLPILAQILQSLDPSPELSESERLSLLMKGAIVALEQDGSTEAVAILENAAVTCPAPDARDYCRTALLRLAQAGNCDAVSALFRLAIERDDQPAADLIRQNNLAAVNPVHQVLFTFLFGEYPEFSSLDPVYERLTQAYLSTEQPSLRNRLLKAAERHGMENWIWIVLALREPSAGSHNDLIERFHTLTLDERRLAVDGLAALAEAGDRLSQSTICEICILFEDELACRLAVEREYEPLEPTRQALFYFLTEQWDDYDRVDFSTNLISAAFEPASPTLRQRILAHSRYTGRVEWLGAGQGRRLRWLSDLSDADWQASIDQLAREKRFDALWKLAQSAPPFWSAQILTTLAESEWTPVETNGPDDWHRLVDLAGTAVKTPLDLTPKRSLNVSGLPSSIAASPDGRLLAVGGPDPQIQLWKFPHGPWQTPLSGPVSQVRALVFNPSSETLACAGGDHTLRVFRLSDGQMVKSFSGHTGLVRSLAIHPDGRTIFSASFDGTLRAWRYPLGSEIARLEPGGELFGLALSENGQTVLTAGSDRLVHVWKWPQAIEVDRLAGANDAITSLAAAESGQLVAAYSRDHTVRVWNHASGRLVQQINLPGAPVTVLKMHSDQQLLFGAAYDGSVSLWNLSTGQTLTRAALHKAPVTGLDFLPEDKLLVTSAGREILLWDLELFLQVRTPAASAEPEQIRQLETRLKNNAPSPSAKVWMEFTLELLRWKTRYDIQISEPQVLQLGEFDIQL